MNGKKRDLGNGNLMPKHFKLSLLEEHNRTPLSEKENKLLDRGFWVQKY